MKFLKKLILTIILFLIGIYLSFPYWSNWLLEYSLPQNASLHSYKTTYPGLQGQRINELTFSLDEKFIKIDELQYDYQMQNISISRLNITFDGSLESNNNTIARINSELNNFLFLNYFNNININNILISYDDGQLILSNIKLHRIDKNRLNLIGNVEELLGQSNTLLTFNSNIALINNGSGLLLDLDIRTNDGMTIKEKLYQVELSAFSMLLNSELTINHDNKGQPFLELTNTNVNILIPNIELINQSTLQQTILTNYNQTAEVSDVVISTKSFSIDSYILLSDINTKAKVVLPQDDNDAVILTSKAEVRLNLVKNDQLTSHGNILLSGLKLPGFEKELSKNIEINWTELKETKQLIETKGNILINEELLTPYSFKYDPISSALSFDVQNQQLSLAMINQIIKLYDENNKLTLTILSGDITHSINLNSSDKFSILSELKVNNAEFQVYENIFSEVNFQQQLSSMSPLRFQSLLRVNKLQLSSGLMINNITSKIIVNEEDKLEITEIQAELLKGTLDSDRVIISGNKIEESIFTLNSISLTDLVAILDISGLLADGKLNMTVPLAMTDNAVSINDGHFKAVGKGIIKYKSNENTTDEDNIAFKALENFHYEQLDGSISYNNDGEYLIKLHLLGANPELYDGYPVDFTLNINGTLSGVFRSLFLTGNFEQAVRETINAIETE